MYCLHFNILADLNSNLLHNIIKRLCRDKMQNSDGRFGHNKSYVRGRKEGRAPSAPPPPGSASAEFIDLNKLYVRQDGRALFHFYHEDGIHTNTAGSSLLVKVINQVVAREQTP